MKINTVLNYIFILLIFSSCQEVVKETSEISAAAQPERKNIKQEPKLSDEFKNYWYAGEAEITSYSLEQARYGEMREGKAVLIYVTEDFLPEVQVKADNYNEKNIPVLKLNFTKNFNTGIYPYSIMQSTFFPVANNANALKIAASIQEWCGQIYTQINSREDFEVISHSYFQGEADQNFNLNKTWTENEIWTKLRISPNSLPTGSISMIPSLEYTRLAHKEIKAYNVNARLSDGTYTLSYPDLDRSLSINFNPNFPHEISSWEETFTSGYGASAKTMTSKATRLKCIKTDYWTKNNNSDLPLRDTLDLR